PKIFFGHGMKDAGTIALFDDPNRGFGGVRNGGFPPAHARDFSQIFSSEGCVPVAARQNDVLRVPAAPLILNSPHDFTFDVAARAGMFEAPKDFLSSTFLCPGWEQRRTNAGARRGIRILINGRIHASLACLIDKLQRLDALAPVSRSDDLVMRELSRKT